LTFVVNVSKNKGFTVYIGRKWGKYEMSKWHNPFHLWDYNNNRKLVLNKYEEYIRSKPELMASIPELVDQVLGCWCYPEECHGDVLVKLVKEYEDAQSIHGRCV